MNSAEKKSVWSKLNLETLSIPIFFATMGIEYVQTKKAVAAEAEAGAAGDVVLDPIEGYERRDTLASLAMGVGSLVVGAVLAPAIGRVDGWLFDKSKVRLRSPVVTTAVAIATWDFFYYWNHRWSHEVRWYWASHVVHHSSQKYNLSTALRQPWSGITLHAVYAPMFFVGVTPAAFVTARGVNLLYQYWIHTEMIDRLPAPLEKVLNTASHHRVHHGSNPQYLDRNYGSILIVWDRLFGTFEPEREPVTYGLTKNISTFNPLGIATHEYRDILSDVRNAKGLGNKLRHIFGRPGWRAAPAVA